MWSGPNFGLVYIAVELTELGRSSLGREANRSIAEQHWFLFRSMATVPCLGFTHAVKPAEGSVFGISGWHLPVELLEHPRSISLLSLTSGRLVLHPRDT